MYTTDSDVRRRTLRTFTPVRYHLDMPESPVNTRGLKPEWARLPKRHCENCPKRFKPSRPEQRFCSGNCRKSWNKYGGAYSKLRQVVLKMIEREIQAVRTDLVDRIEREMAVIHEDVTAQIKKALKSTQTAQELCPKLE